jgi:peptide/nickel transport system permease protein
MTESGLREPNPSALSVGPPGSDRSMSPPEGPADPSAELTYQYGLEIDARSQWAYARGRFLRHRLAVGSLVLLLGIFACGAFANFIAPYTYQEINLEALSVAPSSKHLFGTDSAGRDSLSRVLYGIRTSARVGVLVGVLSTLIGTIIGGLAGFYGGWLDNLLMRVTDLFLTLPLLAVLLVSAKYLGHSTPLKLALLLAFLIWTQIARIVRGSFLSLREKSSRRR